MEREEKKRIVAIRNGSLKEFERLFREFYVPLLEYSKSIIKDEAEAEEIIQDLFYNFWKNRQSLDIVTSLKSYLFRSVYNNSLQFLKHRQVKLKYEKYMMHKPEKSVEPIDELKAKELQHLITKSLEELPERCQQIFSLNRFDGLKYKEIADKLSISIKTVEANMTKALKHFRKSLGEYVGNVS